MNDKYILLKTGEVLECTAAQYQKLTIALLSHALDTKVKLGGKTFKLEDMEDDASKIAKHRQTFLGLNDKHKEKVQKGY